MSDANHDRTPIAHLVLSNGTKEALYLEDLLAIVMALEGRYNLIKEGLRDRLVRRIETLYGVPGRFHVKWIPNP